MPFSGLVLLARMLAAAHAAGVCQKHTLDFILLDGDSLSAQIEDDIRADLAEIGVEVNTRLLAKDDFNVAMTSGDFNLCFTESWGPPYDPHSYAASWFVSDEAHYAALDGLEAPMTKATLQGMVTDALSVENPADRQAAWAEILQEMHRQAISNPMWSRTMPAVINNRLSGYTPGFQQFEYPLHLVNVADGSTTITLAPGAQTGIFGSSDSVPRNDPHSYRPNEFFINNWIYEGLVSYGSQGAILPSLANSWTVADISGGGQEYRFALRPNVKFHDGSNCDCAAVKMTFDHSLEPPLNSGDWHGWYLLPTYLQSWECDGEVFVARLSQSYYPFLQELSFIRPIRVLSPNCYANGPTSDPVTNNSCPTGWDADISELTCAGVQCYAGTGPWKYVDTTLTSDGHVQQMSFTAHSDWWGNRGDVTDLVLRGYTSSADVKAALLSGELDMVVGGGVLTPVEVREFEHNHDADFQVLHGPPLMNTIVVMNSAKAPTNDLALRKVVMHAIDKASIVDSELAGSTEVADSLFPKDAPYCRVDLTPRWDYDLEKAQLMNCPAAAASGEDSDNTALIVGLTLGLGIPLLLLVGLACFFSGKRSERYKAFNESVMPPAGEGGQASVVGNSNP